MDTTDKFLMMEDMLKSEYTASQVARIIDIPLNVVEDYILLNKHPDIMGLVLVGAVGQKFALNTLKRHPERASSIIKKASLLNAERNQ